MEITEKKLTDVVIGKKCDICNKEYYEYLDMTKFMKIQYKIEGYQGFSGSHIKKDICSGECFLKALKKYMNDWGNSLSLTNFNNDIVKEVIKYIE